MVKTGTNDLHGSVYEYLNNRNLNAVDSLKSVQGFTSNPRFDYNRFGGTVGGPIIKNKLFYFADWEYSPLGQASTPGSPIQAPTAAGYQTIAVSAGHQQDEPWRPAAVPRARPHRYRHDQGGRSVHPDWTGAGRRALPIVNKQNLVTSVDWNIGDKDQIRGRYLYNRYTGIDTNAQLPVFYTHDPGQPKLDVSCRNSTRSMPR